MSFRCDAAIPRDTDTPQQNGRGTDNPRRDHLQRNSNTPFFPPHARDTTRQAMMPMVRLYTRRQLRRLFIRPRNPTLLLPTKVMVISKMNVKNSITNKANVNRQTRVLRQGSFRLQNKLTNTINPSTRPNGSKGVSFQTKNRITTTIQRRRKRTIMVVRRNFCRQTTNLNPRTGTNNGLIIILRTRRNQVHRRIIRQTRRLSINIRMSTTLLMRSLRTNVINRGNPTTNVMNLPNMG